MILPTSDILTIALSAIAVIFALSIPPAQLAARSAVRSVVGPVLRKSRSQTVMLGVCLGAVSAILLVGLRFEPRLGLMVAVLVLLMLLAFTDVVWRWLPIEWCVLVGLLGLLSASLEGTLDAAFLGAALGGGTVFAMRLSYLLVRKVEGIGLGDVWLVAALGTLVGPSRIFILLGVAAILGLLLNIAARTPSKPHTGVAFGAQLCVATLFLLGF